MIGEKGISLKSLFIHIIVTSTVTIGILLFTVFNTFIAFEDLSSSTSKYAMLQETANELLQTSDFLTEEAQCYTVNGDRRHLENYFAEVDTYKNREQAISTMEEYMPNSKALTDLKSAMSKSVALMDKEFHAMKLVLSAKGEAMPQALELYDLTPEEVRLSYDDKMMIAQSLTHNDEYYKQKEEIYADLESCIEALKSDSYSIQLRYKKKLHHSLIRTTALIIIESLMLVVTLAITLKIIVSPTLKAAGLIKKDEHIPVSGSNEFRTLAEAYNKIFDAYKKNIDSLSYKAYHDELTNLYNRAGFDLVKENINPDTTAFILIDTDGFKSINDTYGHAVGDKVLIKIADTISNNFRPEDYVFRFGGDEFAVFMLNTKSNVEDIIKEKIELINDALGSDADGIPKTSISVGVAMCDDHANFNSLYKRADQALYAVKENGKHGYSISSD